MKQGEIWYADLNPVKGREQAGFRPVVIVSGNLANELAPVLLCCPLTTKLKHYKGNPILEPDKINGLKKSSEVLVIQLRAMAKDRLTKKIGSIHQSEINLIKKTINELLVL